MIQDYLQIQQKKEPQFEYQLSFLKQLQVHFFQNLECQTRKHECQLL